MKKIALTDSFAKVARFKPEDLQYFGAWNDGHINFWTENAVYMLQFTPDTLVENMDFILQRLKESNIDLIRVNGNAEQATPNRPGYQFFYTPEFISQYEDHKDMEGRPALIIDDIPSYLTPEEIADFKHSLMAKTKPLSWTEFSHDSPGLFQSDTGSFCYRSDRISMMFAIPDENILAIETNNGYRSFVPMRDAHDRIAEIAKTLPQLRRETIYPMTPLFIDPNHFNGLRLHQTLTLIGRSNNRTLRTLRDRHPSG
jgi:hypothetical protein